MKRIVEPFCVIYLLLPIGSFSSCARKPPGASLPLSTFTFWQAGIVLLLLLMTSLSIILHYRYRRMKTRIQKEKEMAYLEACRIVELEKQKAMQLANKLIEEKKEMAVQQSRAIIEQAKEEARQLQAQVTTTSVMLANNTDCRRIAKEIRTNLTEADHWSDFIKNFNLLHSHYVDRIVKTHPGLTANEVRLICFILSGLSNKEIASIFSVEPESVKKARYRLKKKLHLKEEESLSFYLHNLRTTTDSVEVQ
jgi:DNA-binding CsgD family transcriptional regulator